MAIDWKAYWQGQNDCRKVKNDITKIENPYDEKTERKKWESWNLGWNAVDFKEFDVDGKQGDL